MKKIILFCACFLALTATLHAKDTTINVANEVANCELIGYPEWRDDCYEALGKKVQTYSLCLKISNPVKRSECLAANPPKSDADCLGRENSRDIDACFIQLKDARNDLSICKKIQDRDTRKSCYTCSGSEAKSDKERNLCFEFLARKTQDKSVCDMIDNKTAKNACINGMTTAIPVEGCEQPANFTEFKLCKQFAIAQSVMKNTKPVPAKAKVSAKTDELPQTRNMKAAMVTVKKQEKAEKLQQSKDAISAKTEAMKDKAQEAKDARAAKIQEAKDARAAKAQEKADKLQQMKDDKAAKAQEAKDARAAKIQEAKDAKAAKAQEKADKLQQMKDDKAAKAQEAKDARAAKIQEAKDAKAAKAQEKADKLQQMKDDKAAKAQEAKDARAAKIQKAKDAKAAKAQEKADKLQQMKDAKAAKLKEKAAKVTKARTQSAKTSEISTENTITTNEAVNMDVEIPVEIPIEEAVEESDFADTPSETSNKDGADKPNNDKDPNSKINESMSMSPKAIKAQISDFGCTKGFGGWVEPPLAKKVEIACDKENLAQFRPLLNRCTTTDRDPTIILFDVNKDGCTTCADLQQWQKKVNELYKAKKRSTNGNNLSLKECNERKF
ncbi:MAG: hypothetical protein H6754_05025 [Candidatus Omnitrophica bacterium]|nr:hypothetical protein [Candidatus Omnitrophota bacterium]